MIYDRISQQSLAYQFYRLGLSRNQFRGPKPDLAKPYIAFIGSVETYGKYVVKPFTHRLQDHLELTCANLAEANAGVDLILKDPVGLSVCKAAKVTVISVMGAHNMSNRMYQVHPRHNDRFIRASDVLLDAFPSVDFTDIHYTKHLLNSLRVADLGKFSIVMTEMKKAWVARMTTLIEQLETKVVLLWMANHVPPEPGPVNWAGPLGADPLFVDQHMLDQISPKVAKVIECVASPTAQSRKVKGMVFAETERAAAEKMPGPAFHKEAAAALAGPLKALLNPKKPAR